jgi:enamine deaminase RidA (YjgF/YER057c/UK114 family)
MVRPVNAPIRPEGVAAPAAAYELAVVSPAGSAMLHTAGIVGRMPDGSTPPAIGDQAAEAWRTVGAILDEAGFEATDIVSYTTYAVVGQNLTTVMSARDAFLGDHRAASILITVPALARPEWKVEVAVIAARSAG